MSVGGKMQTVLGVIDPAELGFTLPHEQLLYDISNLFVKDNYTGQDFSDLEFELPNMGNIRQYPYSVKKNLKMTDDDVIISELQLYKKAGGRSIIDTAANGMFACREKLPRISGESGVHIICGTGFYVDSCAPSYAKTMSEREMVDFMVKEITMGIGDTGIKAGIIGEIGCSWPLTDFERCVLRAAAICQKETGAPLVIHPGRDVLAPFEILDILEKAGADISHTVMSHLDRTFDNNDDFIRLAKRGCYLSLDQFGIETSHYQLNPSVDHISDAARLKTLHHLVSAGYTNQLMISHDMCLVHRLSKYGGHGFQHIPENVVPKMLERSFTKEAVKMITEDNPREWLTFTK
ncbi:phosphotriesterase-related protein-like [Dysidea avara]|uniref:phosphotriesterase-related protein-like n=1 Tax=Dysidea avara TaxID=196820 RepID=UPI00332C3CFB